MIDKTKEYWTGDSAQDIVEYLRLFTDDKNLVVKPVLCHTCGKDIFELNIDQEEDAIEVQCSACKSKKILLDCEDIWDDVSPKIAECPICKGTDYNVQVGLQYRENGCVNWVYIGNRCCKCKTLGSYLDWSIDYEPTDELENNI